MTVLPVPKTVGDAMLVSGDTRGHEDTNEGVWRVRRESRGSGARLDQK